MKYETTNYKKIKDKVRGKKRLPVGNKKIRGFKITWSGNCGPIL